MEFFPLFLDLKNQPVLVVGGAESARNKLELLIKAGAKITLLADSLHPSLKSLLLQEQVTQVTGPFEPSILEGMRLVYVASTDPLLAAKVSGLAQARSLPVNVVDDPKLCSFITPSIVDRSPLVLAVSSSGSCPRLSRLVRAKLESLFPQSYSRLALMMGEFRRLSKTKLVDPATRRRFWDKIFTGPIIEMFLSGQEKMAQMALQTALEDQPQELKQQGEVHLVGAGPGDPDLLTLRALRLIQNADVIVYDRLVSPVILDYARREAEKIYVGKQRADHTVPQSEINQQLVTLAKAGKMVVRLKGGDPFIFGRGGEELEELVAMGVDFQVVPGVTAASGCCTYAGIPLTHRDFAQSVRLITGHRKKAGQLSLDWDNMVSPNQTLVFYMGLFTMATISEQLIKHGMSPTMPVALIENGTTYSQRVFVSTLSHAPTLALEEKIFPPTLIVVGAVVGLREKLKWFDPAHFDPPQRSPFQQP